MHLDTEKILSAPLCILLDSGGSEESEFEETQNMDSHPIEDEPKILDEDDVEDDVEEGEIIEEEDLEDGELAE